MKEYLKIFTENDLHILSEYKNQNEIVKWKKCSCGHTFEYPAKSIKRNIKRNGKFNCPICNLENSRLSFEEVKENVLKSTQGEFKVSSKKEDYLNTKSKIKIFHKTCGEETEITYKNFSLGRRCKHCAAKTMNSKASQLLKRLLKQVNIDFIEEKKFENCINPMTGRQLPFDFYIEKINTIIEIDGEQHFIPVPRFGGEESLKTVKYRDYIKDKYCLDNNINLIRISLLDFETEKKKKYDEIKQIIFNLLNDLSLLYYKGA